MLSQIHTVSVCLSKKHQQSTMAPSTEAETVQDDEGIVGSSRGRGKLLENRQFYKHF
jgi:hypothetical protein